MKRYMDDNVEKDDSSPVWPEAVKRWFWAFVKFSGGGIYSVSSIRAMASCLLEHCPIIR